MDYQIIWMDEAIADLRSIVQHIANDNPDAALQWGQRLLRKPRVLSDHPRFGRLFKKLGRDDVRELNEPPYRIIYHVRDEVRESVARGARRT
jgi:plasmid stabilization system protein ParE